MKRPPLYSILFLVLSVVAAVFLIRRFGVDAAGVWASVRNAKPGFYLLAFLSFYASLVVRAWRWRVIMYMSAGRGEDDRLPSVMACTQYILIGRFADSLSWVRVGNFYRAYLVAYGQESSISRTLGTIAAEHVLDVAVVFGATVGVGAILATQNRTTLVRQAIIAASIGAGLVMLALLLMRRYGTVVARWLPVPISRAYSQFHRGTLDALGFKQLPSLFTLTGLGWLCAVVRWYFVAAALDAPVSFPMVLFVSLANAVLTAIPATPAGLGLAEPGVSALLATQLPAEEAIAVTLSERFISYVSVVVIGGVMFLGLGLLTKWRRKSL